MPPSFRPRRGSAGRIALAALVLLSTGVPSDAHHGSSAGDTLDRLTRVVAPGETLTFVHEQSFHASAARDVSLTLSEGGPYGNVPLAWLRLVSTSFDLPVTSERVDVSSTGRTYWNASWDFEHGVTATSVVEVAVPAGTAPANFTYALELVPRRHGCGEEVCFSIGSYSDRRLRVTDAPTRIEIVSPASNPGAPLNGVVRISGTASDPTLGISHVEVRTMDETGKSWQWLEPAKGTNSWTYDWRTWSSPGGAIVVLARATNSWGEIREVGRVYHTDAPRIDFTAPAADAIVSGVVRVSGTAYDSGGLKEAWYIVDDLPWARLNLASGATGAPWTWFTDWNTDALPEGPHAFDAGVRDRDDRVARMTRTFTVDRPPRLTFAQPAESAVRGAVVLGGTAEDTTLEAVEVRIGGGPWSAASGLSTWTYSWDTTTDPSGSVTVAVRATDARSQSRVLSRTFEVDNAPPTVEISRPGPSTGVTYVGNTQVPVNGRVPGHVRVVGPLTVAAAASDVGSRIHSVQICIYGDNGEELSCVLDTEAPHENDYWAAAGKLDRGYRTITAQAFDLVGHASAIATRAVHKT